jgi:uncharacterized protein YjbI with pentapeptide repeats
MKISIKQLRKLILEQSLRRPSNNEIESMLEDHRKFLDGKLDEPANFSNMDLSGKSNFNELSLVHANFENANLSNCILNMTNFSNCNMRNVNFSRSNLKSARFTNADLSNANLSQTNLKDANFQKAILQNANLLGANVSEFTFFRHTDIRGTKFDDKIEIDKLGNNLIRNHDDKINRKNPKIKPEDENEIFNKYAWADKKRQEESAPEYESSSEIENDVYRDLASHFEFNSILKKSTADILKDLLQRKKYPDVIQEYQDVVFRGMRVSKQFLENTLGKDLVDSINVNEAIGNLMQFQEFEKSFVFKPKKGGASSWTESMNVAKKFADKSDDFSIILMATHEYNKNKFLKCSDALYKIDAFSDFSNEHEIVALGDIVIKEILVRRNPISRSEAY